MGTEECVLQGRSLRPQVKTRAFGMTPWGRRVDGRGISVLGGSDLPPRAPRAQRRTGDFRALRRARRLLRDRGALFGFAQGKLRPRPHNRWDFGGA